MRVSIYNEPAGIGIGGSEFVAASLAEAFSKEHTVDLFHRIPTLTLNQLAENSGTDLSKIQLRLVESSGVPPQFSTSNPSRYYKAARAWLAELSEPYDLFVAIVHGIPPFCHAKNGALIVLFPGPSAPYIRSEGGLELKLALKHPGRYLYHSWAWKQRMKSYAVKTAISDFSRQWAQRRWRIQCEVVYPPVDTRFRVVQKDKLILSVGRFAIEGDGHKKNQEEMLRTFGQMKDARSASWRYASVGGLGGTPAHKAYFERLSALAISSDSQLSGNVDREELQRLYERASIFWHAAGYGEDQNTRPIFVEHFGISTVEAMAPGGGPVVINKGGQSEIVEHELSGFLWDTLDELRDYTARLINDDGLRARMSQAARKRSQVFSKESFVTKFMSRIIR